MRFNPVTFLCLIAIIFLLLFSAGCNKNDLITSPDASIRFTQDTIKFDTVFTTTGSVVKSFKVINNNNRRLRFSEIKLAGNQSSFFNLNFNGVPGNVFYDADIAANDSAYVFVTVNINPTAANLPFVVQDSISFSYNGNTSFVQLQAYGQNAIFLRDSILTANTSFTSAKPYVILGGLYVAPGVTLNLLPGTRVYAHANAPVVVDGSLQCTGTIAQPVIFTGDRLDAPYVDFPASWPGIYFRSASHDNRLIFTEIKNAYQALVVLNAAGAGTNPKLFMQQCIVSNAYDAGIVATNSSVQANNCLMYNCGSNVFLQGGGSYNFTNCTFAGYSNRYLLHANPSLSVLNYQNINGSAVSASMQTSFVNCIIHGEEGSVDNEIVVDKKGTTAFQCTLDHCLYKAVTDPANTTFVAPLKNMNPFFDSINTSRSIYNFHISSPAAPIINYGVSTSFSRDLDNLPRAVAGATDLGCYEKQ